MNFEFYQVGRTSLTLQLRKLKQEGQRLVWSCTGVELEFRPAHSSTEGHLGESTSPRVPGPESLGPLAAMPTGEGRVDSP